MRVLAVGERFNQRAWKPRRELNLSFELRRRMGVYNRGPRRAFLERLGVRWDDGVNLLWPCPLLGEWDAAEAKRVARAIRDDAEKYDVVLLFGRRVCDAFGVPFRVGELHEGRWLPLPHPSGRSRLWNDPDVREKVRRACER